jgi:transcriptional regulator with XRE-family HTH domain
MNIRLKETREARGLSAVLVAEKLQIHRSTLDNWEAERRDISLDKLVQLAEILGVTVDYLLGRDIPQASLTEPLDKELLWVIQGQPVWAATHGWMLVNIAEKAFVLANLSLIAFDEVNEPIYLIPPAMSFSLRGLSKPLGINNIPEYPRIWVEPITCDSYLAAELRGWYSISNNRFVQNEFGNKFYFNTYGAKWLAFRDCLGNL